MERPTYPVPSALVASSKAQVAMLTLVAHMMSLPGVQAASWHRYAAYQNQLQQQVADILAAEEAAAAAAEAAEAEAAAAGTPPPASPRAPAATPAAVPGIPKPEAHPESAGVLPMHVMLLAFFVNPPPPPPEPVPEPEAAHGKGGKKDAKPPAKGKAEVSWGDGRVLDTPHSSQLWLLLLV